MKHSSQNSNIKYLYLEPYTFSVVNGNDVLIYNSLNRKILEYRGAAAIAKLINKTEDAAEGFLAEIVVQSGQSEISTLIKDLKKSFSGDLVLVTPGNKPSVIRPKPVIKNYPPAKDFPSFSADDYLRNIYFFLNEDNNTLCTNYRFAPEQFSCPVYNSQGYSEMDFGGLFNACSPHLGVSGIGLDLSGSDITRYSQFGAMLKQIRKLSLPLTFHIPLPCHESDLVLAALRTGRSRVSFYITFPDGPSALRDIRKHPEFIKKQKRIDLNFLIQSLREYQSLTELLNEGGSEKTFIFPYFNGLNTGFFEKNVFLAKNDILNLKPNQQQIYSRSLINEHLFGKIFIKTNGDAYANLNHGSIGNIKDARISDLVRNELYNGKSWNLTRMKVKPCSDCLYRLFCPPVGNYELFMKKFNFCDVL
jgi:pseudo-rSAM protein